MSELIEVADKNTNSLICPLSTQRGSGHNHMAQSIEVHYNGLGEFANNPENYQKVQDEMIKIKKSVKSAKKFSRRGYTQTGIIAPVDF